MNRRMIPNPYLSEKVAQAHREDLLREAEQLRLLARLSRPSRSVSRRAVGKLGMLLLSLGARLKRFEQSHPALEEHV
jgi:hypothetical protein